MFDIDWINELAPIVDYSEKVFAEQSNGDVTDKYIKAFETEFNVSNGEDIGGLIVYNNGSVVFDYENFWGWSQ
jgi:hypothetical protein